MQTIVKGPSSTARLSSPDSPPRGLEAIASCCPGTIQFEDKEDLSFYFLKIMVTFCKSDLLRYHLYRVKLSLIKLGEHI